MAGVDHAREHLSDTALDPAWWAEMKEPQQEDVCGEPLETDSVVGCPGVGGRMCWR